MPLDGNWFFSGAMIYQNEQFIPHGSGKVVNRLDGRLIEGTWVNG